MYKASVYKGVTTAVIVILLLSIFCVLNVEKGSSSYYLCLFTFILDVPFLIFLVYKNFSKKKSEIVVQEKADKLEEESKDKRRQAKANILIG